MCVASYANFEINEISNSSIFLGGKGCDDLKVRTPRGSWYLENIQNCTR